jgi:U3 small nucleolar RNA-associated protein 10
MLLKDDTLEFLAGIWTSPVDSSTTPEDDREYRFQQAALSHATAFLIAHQATENWVDFQAVLPLVLYVLNSPNQCVREAAVQFLLLMEKICEAEKPIAIYGFDTLYGENTSQCHVLLLSCRVPELKISSGIAIPGMD